MHTQAKTNFMGVWWTEWIFILGNSIFNNAISGNNFLKYNILGVFDLQIEFLVIFDKISKIPLMEEATGSGWLWVVIGVFWSFHNGKYSLPMGMLDSHRRDGNILRVIFIPVNAIFPRMLLQISYQILECFHISG